MKGDFTKCYLAARSKKIEQGRGGGGGCGRYVAQRNAYKFINKKTFLLKHEI